MKSEKSSALKLVPSTPRVKRPTKAETAAVHSALVEKIRLLENPEQSEVVEAVKIAFNRRNRLAALWGLVKGGWAPLASYYVAHQELDGNYYQPLTLLVAGALLFSAPTVYEWCVAAFHSKVKAVGFVVLLEGVMVFSKLHWLAISAVFLLVAINGIQSACNLAIRKPKNEFQF